MKNTFPKIAMGAWAWGDKDCYFGNTMDNQDFRPIFKTAIENGLNLWDTATAYGNGASEEILGSFIKEFKREDIIVSTKFTPQMAAMYDNSVEKMCEASLKRMELDYIDIYWIHNAVGAPHWTQQLIPLLQSGKVKSVGVSNHNLAEIKEADNILKNAGFKISAVQNHYSLLNRTSEYGGILDYCKENNISFWAYMVLEQGALSGKYDSQHPFSEGSARAQKYNPLLPQIEKVIQFIRPIAEHHNASVAQIVTSWAINKGVLPIIGVTHEAQVKDAAQTAKITLSNDEINNIEQAADSLGISTIREWEKDMNQ